MANVVADAPLATPVPSCPGWDLRALAEHLGSVHRWAARAAATASAPPAQNGTPPPDDDDGPALGRWLRTGAADLVATLRTLDPEAPTWHLFPGPQVAAIWPRRQAQETIIHAWDAEFAVDAARPPNPVFALDGIAEYYELVIPRVVDRDGLELPAGTFAVRTTDTANTIAVAAPEGRVVTLREPGDAAPDATLVGTAAGCLGRLWNRPIDDHHVTVEGDAAVAAAWLALPGL